MRRYSIFQSRTLNISKMRALYLNQLERYKQKWYKMHNQKPPNLGFEEETQKNTYQPQI